jgi:hypothetical protein
MATTHPRQTQTQNQASISFHQLQINATNRLILNLANPSPQIHLKSTKPFATISAKINHKSTTNQPQFQRNKSNRNKQSNAEKKKKKKTVFFHRTHQ